MFAQVLILFSAVVIVCPVVFLTTVFLCNRYLINVTHPDSLLHRLYERRCGK
ncbi:MAG: hypothetical protein WCT20_02995 [Candidatus Babeliales bacterium]